MPRFRFPPEGHEHGLVRLDSGQGWVRTAVPYSDSIDSELSSGGDAGGLVEYWRMIRRRKGTVILAAFVGTVLGILAIIAQTPVYQARASLEVLGVNENFLNMRDVNPNATNFPYAPEVDLQTHVKILQSRSLVERTVSKVDLGNRPLLNRPGRLVAWRKALGLTVPPQPPVARRIVAGAPVSLKVRALPNTRLIEVLYESTDPEFAAEFVNTLAGEFMMQNLEGRAQTSKYTGDWLTAEMQELKIKLEKSEQELQNYARAAGLLFTAEKDNVADDKLKQLQQELLRAQTDRVTKQSRYELARSTAAEALPEVLDDRTLQEYQSKLTDLKRQAAELSSALTPANPKVIKLQAQVDTMQAALDRERANVVQRIRNEYVSAQRREDLLAADYRAQVRSMTDQAGKVSHYNMLKRDVDATRQLHDSMQQRVKEAHLASALNASNIRVIDPAKPPDRPYKPSVVLDVALGLMAGLVAGVGAAALRERADRTIQEPGDSALLLNVSELGIIPSIEGTRLLGLRAHTEPEAERLLGSGVLGITPGTSSPGVAVTRATPSVFSDSFRTAVTSILFSGQNGDRPHVLVVSSANPGEGKTTIVSNLAAALADINIRVLLIDGDLRKPRLHDLYSVDLSPGLAEVLAQPQGTAPAGFIRQTETRNLFLLTSGAGGHTAILYSPRLPELLRTVRSEFDIVLIDSPPMLQMSDARVLGRHSDAVILVVRSEQTTRDAALLACERLAQDGTRVLGTILNDWDPRRTTAYGYSKYYDRYDKYYHGRQAS